MSGAASPKQAMDRVARGIQRCRRCERSGTRGHAVPGEGSVESGILLLGEAPGKKEDRTARPFVGRAGSYLDQIFLRHPVEREKMFVTSILKCYHPDSPKKDQVEACRPWTEKQIGILRPEIILVMGRTAEQGLWGMTQGGGESFRKWEGIPCVVTCHPAAAMRFPRRHEQFDRDFGCFVRIVREKGLLDG